MSETTTQDMTDVAAAAAQSHADITAATRGLDPERADLLAGLLAARRDVRFTTRGLTEDQVRQRPTASELTLGGIIKHLTGVERNWGRFIIEGPAAMPDFTTLTPDDFKEMLAGWVMQPGETLQSVLDGYAKAAEETNEIIRTIPDLNSAHPLPNAPWFPKNTTRSARAVIVHLISETAQHAGHADIIRESLDGAKSKG